MAKAKSFFETIWHKKLTFLFVYFLVFVMSYLILVAIDFIPEPKSEPSQETKTESVMVTEQVTEREVLTKEEVVEVTLPTKIHIERINKTIDVLNPTSRSIADLDNALLSGVVRHPDSAHLMQDGNVFILGHSSYLPQVFNDNFQAFNGIQNLEWGDTIEVYAEEKTFVYRVEKVFKANAQEITVPIAGDDKLLTLATCNSFGSVDDRYIVEARQIEVLET